MRESPKHLRMVAMIGSVMVCGAAGLASYLASDTMLCGGAESWRCPAGYQCVQPRQGEPWMCVAPGLCGNGVVDESAGEECDDGVGDSMECDADCTRPRCGDGRVNLAAGEQCDAGGEDTVLCDVDCTVPECGDGHVNAAYGEACDDGGDSAACNLDCTPVLCGDGYVNAAAGEECDDANLETFDTCLNSCQGALRLQLTAGGSHTCMTNGTVHCWGRGDDGRLGYGNTADIGDDESPASAGDVDVGGTVTQLAVGGRHTCALLDSGQVRCWGDGGLGRLGYGNTARIGDDESPASAGDVLYYTEAYRQFLP